MSQSFVVSQAQRGCAYGGGLQDAFIRQLPAGCVMCIKTIDVGTVAWVSRYDWHPQHRKTNAEQLWQALLRATADTAISDQPSAHRRLRREGRLVRAASVSAMSADPHRGWSSLPMELRRPRFRLVDNLSPRQLRDSFDGAGPRRVAGGLGTWTFAAMDFWHGATVVPRQRPWHQ
jgi:hypothetical protein